MSTKKNENLIQALDSVLADLNQRLHEIDEQIAKTSQELHGLHREKSELDARREDYNKALEHSKNDESLSSSQIMDDPEIRDMSDPDMSLPLMRESLDPAMQLDQSESGDSSAGTRKPKLRELIAEKVYDILKEREGLNLEDRHLHYSELVAELQKKGVLISGKNPGLNLIAHIHKSQKFHRPDSGCYGLAEWYPENSRRVGEHSDQRPSHGSIR